MNRPHFSISWHILLWAIIAAGVWWAYQPSFDQLPRRDHLYYHLEMARSDSLGEIAAKSWSYNRTRTVMPGDFALFRPGTILILALQKWAFDYRFEYWVAVSLVIHLACCFALWRLLIALGGGLRAGSVRMVAAAYCLTVFYALNASLTDVVSWEHIQGYLVFIFLILVALERYVHGERMRKGRVANLREAWPVAALLLLAAFFHETGTIFALLFGAAFALAGVSLGRGLPAAMRASTPARLRVFLLFLVPPLVYALVSTADYAFQSAHAPRDQWIENWQQALTPILAFQSFFRMISFYCIQPLLPAVFQLFEVYQANMPTDVWAPACQAEPWKRVVVAVAGAAFVSASIWVTIKGMLSKNWTALLVCTMLLGYCTLYGILRVNLRGYLHPHYLGINPQYAVFCLPLTLVLLWLAGLAVAPYFAKTARRYLWLAGCTYFLGFAAVGAGQTHIFSSTLSEGGIDQAILKTAREALEEAKRRGVQRIGFAYEEEWIVNTLSAFGVPLTTVFFGRHESEDPDLIALLPSGRLVSPDEADAYFRTPFYVGAVPSDAILLEVGEKVVKFHSSYVMFHTEDRWLGYLSGFSPRPLARGQNFPFLAEAANLEDLKKECQRQASLAVDAAREKRFMVWASGMPLVHGRMGNHLLINRSGTFLAIPIAEGRPINMKDAGQGEISGTLSGDSLQGLLALIEDAK